VPLHRHAGMTHGRDGKAISRQIDMHDQAM
jgi:hypothetical protein